MTEDWIQLPPNEKLLSDFWFSRIVLRLGMSLHLSVTSGKLLGQKCIYICSKDLRVLWCWGLLNQSRAVLRRVLICIDVEAKPA